MDFDTFCKTIREAIATGRIKTAAQLSELDLAIQYAIGREQDARGTVQLTLTPADISQLIKKYCGKAVYARVALDAEEAIEASMDMQMRTRGEAMI